MGQSGTRVDFISNKQASLLSWTSSLSVSSGSCLTLVCKLFTWIKFLRIPDWGFPLALDWWQWHLLTKGGREKCSKNWVPFPPMKWRTWSDMLLGHSLGYGALLGSSEHEVMDASLWNQWCVREPVLLRKLSCCTHGIPDRLIWGCESRELVIWCTPSWSWYYILLWSWKAPNSPIRSLWGFPHVLSFTLLVEIYGRVWNSLSIL